LLTRGLLSLPSRETSTFRLSLYPQQFVLLDPLVREGPWIFGA
jgi:hypothetical protein